MSPRGPSLSPWFNAGSSGEVALRISFDTKGWEEWTQAVIARSQDLSPWFEQVLFPVHQAVERKVYASDGDFTGHGAKWAVDYRPRYAKWKEKRVQHLRKEHLEEKLFEALTGDTDDTILGVGPDYIIVGADPESARTEYHYADVQQLGTLDGSVPPRPPLALFDEWPDNLKETMANAAMEYIITGIMPEFE